MQSLTDLTLTVGKKASIMVFAQSRNAPVVSPDIHTGVTKGILCLMVSMQFTKCVHHVSKWCVYVCVCT